jgi:hypothetical protein
LLALAGRLRTREASGWVAAVIVLSHRIVMMHRIKEEQEKQQQ